MDMASVNRQEIADITISLQSEYGKEEVIDMLRDAEFKYIDGGLMVTYDNGVHDKFYYKTALVHSANL